MMQQTARLRYHFGEICATVSEIIVVVMRHMYMAHGIAMVELWVVNLAPSLTAGPSGPSVPVVMRQFTCMMIAIVQTKAELWAVIDAGISGARVIDKKKLGCNADVTPLMG